MCCWEQIINQTIQRIVKEMHQTAEPEQREWARENILDAEVFEDVKVGSLQVTTEAVKQEIWSGETSPPIISAVMLAYPGYRLEVTVKQPFNLPVLATQKQSA